MPVQAGRGKTKPQSVDKTTSKMIVPNSSHMFVPQPDAGMASHQVQIEGTAPAKILGKPATLIASVSEFSSAPPASWNHLPVQTAPLDPLSSLLPRRDASWTLSIANSSHIPLKKAQSVNRMREACSQELSYISLLSSCIQQQVDNQIERIRLSVNQQLRQGMKRIEETDRDLDIQVACTGVDVEEAIAKISEAVCNVLDHHSFAVNITETRRPVPSERQDTIELDPLSSPELEKKQLAVPESKPHVVVAAINPSAGKTEGTVAPNREKSPTAHAPIIDSKNPPAAAGILQTETSESDDNSESEDDDDDDSEEEEAESPADTSHRKGTRNAARVQNKADEESEEEEGSDDEDEDAAEGDEDEDVEDDEPRTINLPSKSARHQDPVVVDGQQLTFITVVDSKIEILEEGQHQLTISEVVVQESFVVQKDETNLSVHADERHPVASRHPSGKQSHLVTTHSPGTLKSKQPLSTVKKPHDSSKTTKKIQRNQNSPLSQTKLTNSKVKLNTEESPVHREPKHKTSGSGLPNKSHDITSTEIQHTEPEDIFAGFNIGAELDPADSNFNNFLENELERIRKAFLNDEPATANAYKIPASSLIHSKSKIKAEKTPKNPVRKNSLKQDRYHLSVHPMLPSKSTYAMSQQTSQSQTPKLQGRSIPQKPEDQLRYKDKFEELYKKGRELKDENPQKVRSILLAASVCSQDKKSIHENINQTSKSSLLSPMPLDKSAPPGLLKVSRQGRHVVPLFKAS